MNNAYVKEYVDSNGIIYNRSMLLKIKTFLFSGIKVTFDLAIALTGLVLLSPIFLIISILIKIDSRGPVFFKQIRTGRDGKNFILYKFRSCKIDNDVHDFNTSDEHTRVGKILRKTSLDELPQLINIAKLEMSFIGPRPWITDYYDNMNETQRHRVDVKPGLTGLAQCKGRNDLTIFDKINYDLEYIRKYSLGQDIKIIFLTVKSVLCQNGTDEGKSGIKNELDDLKKSNNKIESKKINKVKRYKKRGMR